MSYAVNQAKDSIDVMTFEERLDLLQYLAPTLTKPDSVDRKPSISSVKDLGEGPTALQDLTEMRNASDHIWMKTSDPEASWERLQELGREMDQQAGPGPSLMDILTDMRG